MVIIKSDNESIEMRDGCQYNQNVEDLMRASPDVVFSWSSSFWPASSIDSCAKDVKGTLSN